ncbi:MAG: thioredoxin family protein [Acidimicrobiia bacterium]
MDGPPDRAQVLFFMSPHCSTCKTIRPVASNIARRFDGEVRFTEVDSLSDPANASIHRVRGVPTFIAIHGGTEVARTVGVRTSDQLAELFSAALSGDQIRTRISSADRSMRLGIAGVFAISAMATTTPVLLAFAGAAVLFGTWDLITR